MWGILENELPVVKLRYLIYNYFLINRIYKSSKPCDCTLRDCTLKFWCVAMNSRLCQGIQVTESCLLKLGIAL